MFDLRLDGELDRETFDIKRNELQLKMSRLKNNIVAHEKTDNTSNNTILELMDIATESRYLFSCSQNIELKRFLLHFVFKHLWLTEGKLTYELNFPFSEFETTNLKQKGKDALELVKPLEIKGLQGIESKNIGNDNILALELKNIVKKTRG